MNATPIMLTPNRVAEMNELLASDDKAGLAKLARRMGYQKHKRMPQDPIDWLLTRRAMTNPTNEDPQRV